MRHRAPQARPPRAAAAPGCARRELGRVMLRHRLVPCALAARSIGMSGTASTARLSMTGCTSGNGHLHARVQQAPTRRLSGCKASVPSMEAGVFFLASGCAPCCGTGPAWSGSAPSCGTGSTRWRLISATTGPAATGPARAAAGWPSWTCPGVGEFTALVMLAEIGDITQFASARKLASWAGLTPTVRGSDLTVRHGHISKQGSAWLRWVLNQAAQTAKRSPEFAASYQAIARRRGKKIATIAISRKLLTRAYHLLAGQAAGTPATTPHTSAAT